MTRRILRFLTWLRDSLPLYSARDVARGWIQGVEAGRKQTGLVRDGSGRFCKPQ